MIIHLERFGDRGAQALRQETGLFAARQAELHDGKFIAAQAGDDIAVADRAAQAIGHLFEQAIAGAVAIGIVDRLEAIEIEIMHRDQAVGRHDGGIGLEMLAQGKAIGQGGQIVTPRQRQRDQAMADLCLDHVMAHMQRMPPADDEGRGDERQPDRQGAGLCQGENQRGCHRQGHEQRGKARPGAHARRHACTKPDKHADRQRTRIAMIEVDHPCPDQAEQPGKAAIWRSKQQFQPPRRRPVKRGGQGAVAQANRHDDPHDPGAGRQAAEQHDHAITGVMDHQGKIGGKDRRHVDRLQRRGIEPAHEFGIDAVGQCRTAGGGIRARVGRKHRSGHRRSLHMAPPAAQAGSMIRRRLRWRG